MLTIKIVYRAVRWASLGLACLFVACSVGAQTPHAQPDAGSGCDGPFPNIDEKIFEQVITALKMDAQGSSLTEFEEFLRDNEIDFDTLAGAIEKLMINIEDRKNPDIKLIDNNYKQCESKVRLNDQENALLEKHYPQMIEYLTEIESRQKQR
jgi:hypothetical protein